MIDEIRTLYKQAYILRHLIVDVDADESDFDAIDKKLETIAAIIDRSAESLDRKITAMQSRNQATAPLRKWREIEW